MLKQFEITVLLLAILNTFLIRIKTRATHPADHCRPRGCSYCGAACAPVPATSTCSPNVHTFRSDRSGFAEKERKKYSWSEQNITTLVLRTDQIVEVELVLVRNLEGAVVALFGSGMLRLHVALQVLFKLPARVADAANGFHDGLGLLTWDFIL